MSGIVSAAAYESLMQFLYRAPIGLVQTTLGGEVEMINPTSAQLLVPLSSDGSLDNLFDVLEGVAPQLRSQAQAAQREGDVICDALRVTPPAVGGEAARTLSISLVRLDGGRLMAVLDDVSHQVLQEQNVLERHLRDAALTDALTQMPNRAALSAPIANALLRRGREARPQFAVLFLNCDRFKRVNDLFGTAVGDGLLGVLAARLRGVLRTGESMAARVGGDEFVVLLGSLASSEEALVISQRVIDALGRPCHVAGHALTCSVSGGLLLGDGAEGDADADAVIRDASIAMVEAKRQGGGRFVAFEPMMRERAMQRGRTEAELRLALAEGQLFVVYQPIIALQAPGAGRGCVGVEALVRWRHPRRGVVLPLDFIGVAEECGLICALGDFVLASAVRQLQRWRDELGPLAPGWTAVNLSRAQLQEPEFVASVQALLVDSGLPPQCLQLEVTESLAAQNAAVQAVLQQLRALGVVLALDDFGTGYSSLASLHLFPVEVVKIDRSFTSQVDTSLHHRVLVQATVMVASSLGMSTVVEGVETEAQAALVRQLGCDKGQGYLFSRPLEAQALSAWLQTTVSLTSVEAGCAT
jgi:diguanylate cyclase (GGDEF)-like protein